LFLGRGYYYWENSYEEATKWGMGHYRGNYFIFSGDLTLDLEKLFDITLNQHLLLIKALQRDFKKKSLKLGMFIDFIRDFQNELIEKGELVEEECFFPFYYGKGLDATVTTSDKFERFVEGKGHFYLKSPVVFFCVYDKKYLNLQNFTLIRENGSKQERR
jgi:hypothetical protein